MQFHEKRRQQFLNQRYFEKDIQFFKDTVLPGSRQGVANAEHAADRENSAGNLAYWTFKAYLLRYTAGESLDVLRDELTDVVEAYEQHAESLQDHAQDPNFPVLRFVEIADYERVMQLIGLCFLLHRRELLPRLVAMLDGAYAGKDTLYEDLLAYELEGRYDVDEWYHDFPYRDLINSLYRNTSEESIGDLQRYVAAWYPSMKKAPWHDSHLDTCEDGGAYFGYWAIEAGAVAYLLELDDSSFREHIVYPKDLVDYARELDKRPQPLPSAEVPDGDKRLRVEGGKSCPQTGYWFTPAKVNSRCHFKEGDIMPVYGGSNYGATIWQWSQEQ